ncbi:MAG: M23 family metallopeptidase [Parvularculaceae bacterium]
MHLLRGFAVAGLACLAAACATTPARQAGASSRATISSDLQLCPGVVISNAPSADGSRRISGYHAIANVSGATLYRAPVKACVSSGYGPRKGGASSFHKGVDLYTGEPRTVYAGGDGVVSAVGNFSGYGNTVLIDHGRGVETRYAHLSDIAQGVRRGARVAMGEPIGRTGKTGNATAVHLHYEILVGGRAHNPLTIGQ